MLDTAIALEELVTSNPLQRFYNEFKELSSLGRSFSSLTGVMFWKLENDKLGNRLRDRLSTFNRYILASLDEVDKALLNARWFYIDKLEEKEGLTKVVTNEQVQYFLDIIARRNSAIFGPKIVAALEEAIPILKDQALPILPDIKAELESCIMNYQERRNLSQKRSQSWLPFAVQDLVWGSLELPIQRFDPTTEHLPDIEALPQRLNHGIHHLQMLPNLLEKLNNHFKQLIAVTRTDYESLGYSSPEGFKALYSNRLRCSSLLLDIYRLTFNLTTPFAITSDFNVDKDTTSSSDSRKYI